MLENGLFVEVMIDSDKREISNNLEDISKFIPAISASYEITKDITKKEKPVTSHNLVITTHEYDKSLFVFEAMKDKTLLSFRLYIINNGEIKRIDEFGNANIETVNIVHGDGYDNVEMEISYTSILMKTFGKDKVSSAYHQNFIRASSTKE